MLILAPVRINIVFTSIDVKLAGGDFRTKRRNTISTPYNQLQSYNKFFNYTNMKKTRKIVDTTPTISEGGRADAYARSHRAAYSFNARSRRAGLTESDQKPSDIDPYDIVIKYNLKGFEFGNWLSNNERYDNLIAANESLLFLSWLFNSQNIGFNRMIGIAFGARGKGKALAHYEPGLNMINLTKMKGAGSLAHEYGHAIDYNFGRYIDQHKTHSALSGGSMSARKPLLDNVGSTLRALVNEIVDYPFTLERVDWEDYWGQRNEVFARLFEEYVAYRLDKIQRKNLYLSKSLRDVYYKRSVYLTEAEFKPLIPKFNALVKLMGTILNSKSKVPMPLVPYPLPKAATKTIKESDVNLKEMKKDYDTLKNNAKYKNCIFLFRDKDYYVIINKVNDIAKNLQLKVEKKDNTSFVKIQKDKLDTYLPKIIRHGYKVAIMDPKAPKTVQSTPTATQGTLFSRSLKPKKRS